MRAVLTVAINSFRESARNRVFYGFLIVGMLFILSSLVMAKLAPGASTRIMLDFGYAAISIFGVVIATVMGVIQVYKEIDKKTVYSILTKPIGRGQFIFGKFIGMALILMIAMTVLTTLWLGVLLLNTTLTEGGIDWIRVNRFLPLIPGSLALLLVEQLIVSAFALFFSSFSSPVLSGIFTAGFFVMGRTASMIGEIADKKGGFLIDALSVFGRLLPDLSTFNLSQELIQGIAVPGAYIWQAIGYGVSYIAVMLLAAVFLFNRRDFA